MNKEDNKILNLISNLQKELEYKDDIIHGLGTEVLPISIEGFEVLLNKTKEENDKLQKELDKKDKEIKKLKEDISNMYDEKVVRNILEDECGLSKFEIDEILN